MPPGISQRELPMLPEQGCSPVQTEGLATFFPGYFALVMATGVVSLAAHLRGWEWVALGLFGVNLVAYVVLGG